MKHHRALTQSQDAEQPPSPRSTTTGAGRPRRSLTSLWTRTVTATIAVLLMLAVATLGLTTYQRGVFEHTTGDMETQLDATVTLMQDLRDTDTSMAAVFYEFGSPKELAASLRNFQALRREIDAEFERAIRLMPDGRAGNQLALARREWTRTADEVVAAAALWGTGEVDAALASGSDPFVDDWTRVKNAQMRLTNVVEETVNAFETRTDSARRIQYLVPFAVLAALAMAVLLSFWSALTLRRTVIRPLVALRDTAAVMRDGDLQTEVALGDACQEISDLGEALDDLASSLHSSHRLLHDQAHRDSLTGLANRKALTDHLRERAKTRSRHGTGLLFIDLDDFKFVNDTFGHNAGDQLLTIVAARLLAATRDGELVARLGGDEFAIVLDQGQEPAPGVSLAERVINALNVPFAIEGTTVAVGCSIGVAVTGRDAMDPKQLLKNADMAMYMAKGGGKNRVEVYSEMTHTAMVARMDLKLALTHAVEREELRLHYQPIVELSDRAVVGWEALVRWQHAERGLLAPAAFIPLAEETRDILHIGGWVLDRACQDLAQVLDPERSGKSIQVNVAADQLVDDQFVGMVEDSLRRWDIAPSSLVLEITESALIADTTTVADTLAALRDRGVRVALDDFGTGFSSLRYLQELPVDIIKIDRSFVRSDSGTQPAGMLDVIVAMARTLGIDLIAEGVEEVRDATRLSAIGGLAAQGYLFGRPVPLAEAATDTGSQLTESAVAG